MKPWKQYNNCYPPPMWGPPPQTPVYIPPPRSKSELKEYMKFVKFQEELDKGKKKEEPKKDEKKSRTFNYFEMVGIIQLTAIPIGILQYLLVKSLATTLFVMFAGTPH